MSFIDQNFFKDPVGKAQESLFGAGNQTLSTMYKCQESNSHTKLYNQLLTET